MNSFIHQKYTGKNIRFSASQKGFTLLEIIIAMSIAALIGVAALNLLDNATKSHSDIQARGDRYNQIERALLFISNDLQQIAHRKFRDEFGDKKNNLSSDDSIGKTHLSFTRLGRRNPAGLPRSNLEKLTYLVDEEKLMRMSYAYPDGMAADQALKRTLLDGVKTFKVDFFDGEEWGDIWPVNGQSINQDGSTKEILPVALKLSLELTDLGLIERLFILSDRREVKK